MNEKRGRERRILGEEEKKLREMELDRKYCIAGNFQGIYISRILWYRSNL